MNTPFGFLEALEERIAPASLLVTNTNDAGAGSLRDAIAQSNASPSKDSITFDKSVFVPGSVITLTSGELDITDSVKIKGLGMDRVEVNGNDASRIFNIDDGTSKLLSVSISGVKLRSGHSGTGVDGGAIFNAESLTLSDSAVTNNTSGGDGGGIASDSAGKLILKNMIVNNNAISGGGTGGGIHAVGSGSVQIQSSVISGNFVPGDAGGAFIQVGGSASVEKSSVLENHALGNFGGLQIIGADAMAKIMIKDTTISGNSALNSVGGLYLGDGKVTLDTLVVANNSAQDVGGLASTGDGSVTIRDSQFLHNTASTFNGGGLALDGARPVKMWGSVVSGNVGTVDGGGLELTNGVILTLSDTTISANLAADGAGLYVGDSTASLSKVQMTNNTATGDGGGFLATDLGSDITLNNSTFSGNVSGGHGGAGFVTNAATLTINGGRYLSNTAGTTGGGIEATDSGNVSISQALFDANVAATSGSAVDLSGSILDVLIQSSTFRNNLVTTDLFGNGTVSLANLGAATLSKSLITQNHASGSGGGVYLGGTGLKTLSGDTITQNTADSFGGGVLVALGFETVAINGGSITGNVSILNGGGLANLSLTAVEVSGTAISGNSGIADPNTFGLVNFS